jgi:hypothetical protein
MHGLSWEILMATPRTKERNLWYTLGLIEPIADVAIMLHSFKAIAITIGGVYMDPKAACYQAAYERCICHERAATWRIIRL